jgi:hypothetical protein
MEVYKRETEEIIKRFLDRRIGFHECMIALDAAVAGLIPKMTPEELEAVKVQMAANHAIVMEEMERRRRRS